MTEDLEEVLNKLQKQPDGEEDQSKKEKSHTIRSMVLFIVGSLGLILSLVAHTTVYASIKIAEPSYLAKLFELNTTYNHLSKIASSLTAEKLFSKAVFFNFKHNDYGSSDAIKARMVRLLLQYSETSKTIMGVEPWLQGPCAEKTVFNSPQRLVDFLNLHRFDYDRQWIDPLITEIYSDVIDHVTYCSARDESHAIEGQVHIHEITIFKLQQAKLFMDTLEPYCHPMVLGSFGLFPNEYNISIGSEIPAHTVLGLLRSALNVLLVSIPRRRVHSDSESLDDVFATLRTNYSSLVFQTYRGRNAEEKKLVNLSQFLLATLNFTELPDCYDWPNLDQMIQTIDEIIQYLLSIIRKSSVERNRFYPDVLSLGLLVAAFALFASWPYLVYFKITASRQLSVLKTGCHNVIEKYNKQCCVTHNLRLHILPDWIATKTEPDQEVGTLRPLEHPIKDISQSPDIEDQLFRKACVMSIKLPDLASVLETADPTQFFAIFTEICRLLDQRLRVYRVFVVDQSNFSMTVASCIPCCPILPCVTEVCTLALDILMSCSDVETEYTVHGKIRPQMGVHVGPCTGFVTTEQRVRTRLVGNLAATAVKHRDSAIPNSVLVSRSTATLLSTLNIYEMLPREFLPEDAPLLEGSCYLMGRSDAETRHFSQHRCSLITGHQPLILATRPRYSFDSDGFYLPNAVIRNQQLLRF